mmetsp:Transcript_31334/g.72124  ORF Transcript_31334/g.72124 Transcript_31334/m.72124 type:complete len:162 (+) Transcript_31334:104-589(+)
MVMNLWLVCSFWMVMVVTLTATTCNGFTGGKSMMFGRARPSSRSSLLTQLGMRVVDIDSAEGLDNSIKTAGDALVVIDYSTTTCGPCKVIAPKFDEFSEKYPDAVFLKVMGDTSPDAMALLKREAVRSVPVFHFYVGGDKVDVVSGANAEKIEATIKKHLR